MIHAFNTMRLRCRELTLEDVSEAYLTWLKDPEVNRYLETRFSVQSLLSIREYVADKIASEDEHLFGIFLENRHIGNIKLGPVNQRHRLADISYFIGERSAWGRGFASEAIAGISAYSFETFGLNKLCAGVYEPNHGSAKALEKAGYKREGVRPKHYFLDEKPVDLIEYGFSRDAWEVS